MTHACPACRAPERRTFGTKNAIEIFICRNCSTLYTPPDGIEATTKYDHDYDAGSVHVEIPDFINKRLDQITAGFERFRQTGRFLDMGCGAGVFLDAAARAGWHVEGTEVSESSVDLVRSKGHNVFHGTLEDAHLPRHHFDVIVASDVIEHIPYPEPVLDEIFRLLRPGGLFWLRVPHGRGLSPRLMGTRWSQIEPPVHWTMYSGRGLKRLLERNGFHQVRMAFEGVDPFEIKHVLIDSRRKTNGNGNGFGDVESRRNLCGTLSTSWKGRAVKGVMNTMLNSVRLGDFLKAQCVKPA